MSPTFLIFRFSQADAEICVQGTADTLMGKLIEWGICEKSPSSGDLWSIGDFQGNDTIRNQNASTEVK